MLHTTTHTCGHETTTQLYGKSSERDRRAAYLATTLCPACYAEQQAAESGLVATEMHYSEYKNNYATCKTAPNSYNAETKTIIVYIPAAQEETSSEPTQTATNEELTEMLTQIGAPAAAITKLISIGSATLSSNLSKLKTRPGADSEKAQADIRLMQQVIDLLQKYGR